MPVSSLRSRVAVVALLAWSTAAEAQPAVARVRREQQLVLSELPALGVLELRVAPGVPTLVRFDAEVVGARVLQETLENILWVEMAPHVVVLEPLRELAPGEKLTLEVRFKDGTVPSRLVLQLVSHPGEVDSRLEVELRPRLARPLRELELASPQQIDALFAGLVHSGMMGDKGITATGFKGRAVGSGVTGQEAWEYRSVHRRAIAIQVHNPPGARPWMASEVVRLSPEDVALPADGSWTVHMVAPIEPGSNWLLVLVGPTEDTGAPLRLEVREKGGDRHVLVEGR